MRVRAARLGVTPLHSSASSTLARAVRQGRRLSSCVTYPTRVLTSAIMRPSCRIMPSVGVTSPANMLRTVDFPQPEGPIRQTNSPRRTVKSTLRSACSPCRRGRRTPCRRSGLAARDVGRHPPFRPFGQDAAAIQAFARARYASGPAIHHGRRGGGRVLPGRGPRSSLRSSALAASKSTLPGGEQRSMITTSGRVSAIDLRADDTPGRRAHDQRES